MIGIATSVAHRRVACLRALQRTRCHGNVLLGILTLGVDPGLSEGPVTLSPLLRGHRCSGSHRRYANPLVRNLDGEDTESKN